MNRKQKKKKKAEKNKQTTVELKPCATLNFKQLFQICFAKDNRT